jgi:pilus assembly protein Flp/PilA
MLNNLNVPEPFAVSEGGRAMPLADSIETAACRFNGDWASRICQLFASEDGPTAVEYAVMLALIVCVCIGAIGSIGTAANSVFSNIGNSL